MEETRKWEVIREYYSARKLILFICFLLSKEKSIVGHWESFHKGGKKMLDLNSAWCLSPLR